MKVELGPDAPIGCNGKPGSSGAQIHYRAKEPACDDCNAAAKHYNRLLKEARIGRPVVPRTTSVSSRVPTPNHPIKRYGRYWQNEADAEDYARRDRLRHAARRAGWAYKTSEDLDRFEAYRKVELEKSLVAQEHRALEKVQAARIRKQTGRAKNATLKNEVTKKLVREYRTEHPITDADRLAAIKKMIEDRTPIMDFMIRTSNIVGADLKGKQ